MTNRVTRAGCSYFGVRIPRHVRRDMADLAARGYTGVLHTFSENDFAYYRDTLAELVSISHAAGLTVQASPWGLGRTFGGEAESRWVGFHPEECQVLDDGRRVAAACLNSSAYREFCKEWADWVLECGVDSVFWDEPAWVVPEHVGVDDAARWTCRCDRCAQRFGGPIPAEPTPEVRHFREGSVVDFLREVVAHVEARGGTNTICLLPATEGAQGLAEWDEVAALPGLATLATDPYWKHWGEAAGPFVRRFARLLRDTADRHGVGAQLWLPSFGLAREDIPELEDAVAAAREEGVEDLWTWGYEACGHMTHLATADAPLVWEAVSAALTSRPQVATTETARPDLADLDLRSTRDLVRLLNDEDATVPAAVAEAGDTLAAAIDAVVERMRRGGRLIYAGAGTSGALAALDAAECGSTFGSPPGEVLAVVTEQDADEDDRAAATNAMHGLTLRPEDCVVAVSASGSTPFALAALEVAREVGALGVVVASVRDSRAAALAQHEIAAVVGPEVIAGSTRLKAGTAQKLVLNTISTVTMIRLGRTYGGLMVGVAPGNEKLRERARRNVVLATGASEERVDEALTAAAGDARVALVSLLAGVDADAARSRLEASEGSVRRASGGRLDGARPGAEVAASPQPERESR
ncbi:MAG TPA: N-acetylmuramic acid 6-phosphate etherase [Gaiellaceae bacterium]